MSHFDHSSWVCIALSSMILESGEHCVIRLKTWEMTKLIWVLLGETSAASTTQRQRGRSSRLAASTDFAHLLRRRRCNRRNCRSVGYRVPWSGPCGRRLFAVSCCVHVERWKWWMSTVMNDGMRPTNRRPRRPRSPYRSFWRCNGTRIFNGLLHHHFWTVGLVYNFCFGVRMRRPVLKRTGAVLQGVGGGAAAPQWKMWLPQSPHFGPASLDFHLNRPI